MKPIGIITDNSVQFPKMGFLGADLVKQIPLSISIADNTHFDISSIEINYLPNYVNFDNQPLISQPSSKQLANFLIEIKKEFEEIFIILPSRFLSPVYTQTKTLIKSLPENNKYHLIDSCTFSYGLGMLISKIADDIYEGVNFSTISQNIRILIQQIFGIFYCPNLSYAEVSNLLDRPQAIALDFIGTVPIYTLEDGIFSPLTKVKKMKNYLLCFEEFIDEFEQPQEIIAINGYSSKLKELISLQSHCIEQFRTTNFSFQSLNIANAAIIGPKALGVFVLDKYI